MTSIEKANEFIMNTYTRFPLIFEKGEGMYLTDASGKDYLDFVAGIAVNALGYSHKMVLSKITEQAAKLIHVSNLYYTDPQVELAEKLILNSCFNKAFFCNSGAEAVEAALKLGRKYGSARGRNEIIAMGQSFHGRTYGALSATGQDKYKKGLSPMLPGIVHVPFNDYASLETACNDKTCAIIIEPIQGEGGVIPADKEYLSKLRKLCTEKDIVLIFDEVQCGIGRTGELFAYEYYGVEPDVIALAKGLAGGIPIGAMLAVDKVAAAFLPGDHASTFGGNPLATSVAGVVIDEIQALLGKIRENGEYLSAALNGIKEKFTHITCTRGVGLMRCMEFDIPVTGIINKCLEKGLLLISSGEKVIRFVPPLIVEKQHIDKMSEIIAEVLKNEF